MTFQSNAVAKPSRRHGPLRVRGITSVAAVKGIEVRCVTAQHFVLLRSQLIYWSLCSRTRR